MADLTDSAVAAHSAITDAETGELRAQLSVSELVRLDLDGPTLEMLLAALTAAACDQADRIDA